MAINIKVTNVKQTFEELNAEINKIVDVDTKRLTRQTVNALIEATPVDTGRARNSWKVIAEDINEKKLPPERVIATIDNDVPYIAELNSGSSRQAPSRFIERTVLQYFDADGVIVQVKK